MEVKILAHSTFKSKNSPGLVTFQATYPRYTHPEMLVHRSFSRNSASSRALPFVKLLDNMLAADTAPTWTVERPGMVGNIVVDDELIGKADAIWKEYKEDCAKHARRLNELGIHHQDCNRLIENGGEIHTIITANTRDLEAFFKLRIQPDVYPRMKELALAMFDALHQSTPKVLDVRPLPYNTPVRLRAEQWHLPMIREDEFDKPVKDLLLISAARCARISYLRHDQEKPDYEADIKRAKALSQAKHMCYDDKTEILTEAGWKYFSQLGETDKVASVSYNLSSNTCEFEFEKPSNIYESDYSGEMVSLEGRLVSFNVTPNHRMFFSQRHKWGFGLPEILSAEQLGSRDGRIFSSAEIKEWSVTNQERDYLEGQLYGFYLGDGFQSSAHKVKWRLKRKRKTQYLEFLLESLGVQYLRRTVGLNVFEYVCDKKRPVFRFVDSSTASEKRINEEAFHISKAFLLGTLDGLKNSDGSIKRGTWQYDSTSLQLAQDVQRLGSLCGFVTTIHPRKRISLRHSPCYFVSFITRGSSPRINDCRKPWAKVHKTSYEGKIFCVTVSTGLTLVRRNNCVMVSGNSPFEHQATPAEVRSSMWSGNLGGDWLQLRRLIETTAMTFS